MVFGRFRTSLVGARWSPIAVFPLVRASALLRDRGGGRSEHIVKGSRQLEGHVPQGRDLTAASRCTYYTERRWMGHVPQEEGTPWFREGVS